MITCTNTILFRYMVCEEYCGLHETRLKAAHDRTCNCGNFEHHQQQTLVEEEYSSSEDESDAEDDENKE